MKEAAAVAIDTASEADTPRSASEADTPMMRQYREQKALHPDAVLFFRLGDFYEMFGDDAVRASEILQITLTARSKGPDRIPMCGVPYHSARRYIARLIAQGLRVAICEQVEAPGTGPGIVRREIVRIISPGTVLDEEVLEPSRNQFLAAVQPDGEGYAAALLDASTGEFLCLDSADAEGLVGQLSGREPRELLVPEGPEGDAVVRNLLPLLSVRPPVTRSAAAAFDGRKAAQFLKRHFQVLSLDAFGLAESGALPGAAAAALRYLQETQKTDAAHVDRLCRLDSRATLAMDDAALAHLEVLKTFREGSRKGSLLGLLDRTSTGMGARKLARWLSAPLRTLPEIEARLDAVQTLTQAGPLRAELRQGLKQVWDLERLCARLVTGQGNARDLRSLGLSLAALLPLAQALGDTRCHLLQTLRTPLTALPQLTDLLARALVDEPPVALKEGGLIRSGFDAELDRLIQLSTSGKETLLSIEQRERERTGISSLKIRYNRVFGYYLEVTRANLHLVPQDYIRKQTMVGAERFVTPELKTYEEQVLTAEDARCALELEHFEKLRGQVVAQASALRAAAEAAASLDVLVAFAESAVEHQYTRPTLEDSRTLRITQGRHPVVERMLQGESFVPNDVLLDGDGHQVLVITGPNMAGKSTLMRQVALTVLMAQAGSFVPAAHAHVGLCDRIFTRVGAADSLARGQSTFMVEMTETAHLLRHATPRSLVLLDEVGRGTSTYDGLSIAWAVAEQLHDRMGAKTLFATHYHELTQLAATRERVRNVCMSVKETASGVVFLHRLVEGAASKSFGIEVAKLAGLPREVVQRARGLLKQLGSTPLLTRAQAALPFDLPAPLPVSPEPPVAAAPHPILRDLERLNLNGTTPLDAINLLARWQAQLAAGPGEG